MKTILAFLTLLATASPAPPLPTPAALNCMARTIYHESRGEPIEGQIAVANVIMNRVRSAEHPATPCSVIRQPWQFAYRGPVRDQDAWEQAVEIAGLVYAGLISDQTDGATHFLTREIAGETYWFHGYQQALVIGGHIFLIPGDPEMAQQFAELVR